MRIGVQAHYILHDVEKGAAEMRRYGYRYCDYRDFMYEKFGLYDMSDEQIFEKVKRTREILDAEGIEVSQIHGLWIYPPRDSNEEQLREKHRRHSLGIRAAYMLGAKYYVVHPFMPYGADSSENPERVLEINRKMLTSLADLGEKCGVIVCLENMPFRNFPLASVRAVTDFVKEIGHPCLKICLDTGHAQITAEDPGDAARYIGKDYLSALHVHDNHGVKDEHNIPGNGVINWESFVGALREIGYDGVFSLETAIWDRLEPDERLRRELEIYNSAYRLVGNI